MGALRYRIEFIQFDDKTSNDEGAFIHFETNPSNYADKISKEQFEFGGELTFANELMRNLFAIPGIMDLAITANRIYITKSPQYPWFGISKVDPRTMPEVESEVMTRGIITQVLKYLLTYFNQEVLIEMPTSRMTLPVEKARRTLEPRTEGLESGRVDDV